MHSSGTIPSLRKWKLLYLQYNKGQSEKLDISINSVVLFPSSRALSWGQSCFRGLPCHTGDWHSFSVIYPFPNSSSSSKMGLKRDLKKHLNMLKAPKQIGRHQHLSMCFSNSLGRQRKNMYPSVPLQTFFWLCTNSLPILSLLSLVFVSVWASFLCSLTELDAAHVSVHSPHLIL